MRRRGPTAYGYVLLRRRHGPTQHPPCGGSSGDGGPVPRLPASPGVRCGYSNGDIPDPPIYDSTATASPASGGGGCDQEPPRTCQAALLFAFFGRGGRGNCPSRGPTHAPVPERHLQATRTSMPPSVPPALDRRRTPFAVELKPWRTSSRRRNIISGTWKSIPGLCHNSPSAGGWPPIPFRREEYTAPARHRWQQDER
jgi:hypothetical protein